MTMSSYTKRYTRTRRVCWCKFGWNPTRSFCVICNLVSMSLIQRQGLSLDFACLFIYSLAISPELFVCLSIYENAETLSLTHMDHLLHRTANKSTHYAPPPWKRLLGTTTKCYYRKPPDPKVGRRKRQRESGWRMRQREAGWRKRQHPGWNCVSKQCKWLQSNQIPKSNKSNTVTKNRLWVSILDQIENGFW